MATGKLAEVEQDAIHIQTKRFADQEEERQYNATKVKAPKKVEVEKETK